MRLLNFPFLSTLPPYDSFKNSLLLASDLPGGGAGAGAFPYQLSALTGGTIAITSYRNHPGVIQVSSAAGANSGYVIWAAQQTGILLSGKEHFELIFNPSSFTNVFHRFGFLDILTAIAVVDGVYFEYNGSGVVTGKAANNSSYVTTSSSFTLSTGTWYRATIDINDDASIVAFRIYDMLGNILWGDYIITGIPTTAGRETGIASIIYNTVGGVAQMVELDFILAGITRLVR